MTFDAATNTATVKMKAGAKKLSKSTAKKVFKGSKYGVKDIKAAKTEKKE